MDRGYDSSDDEEEKNFSVVDETEQHDIANLSHSSSNPKNYLDEPDTDEDEDPNKEAKKNFLHYLQVNRMQQKQKKEEIKKIHEEQANQITNEYEPVLKQLRKYDKKTKLTDEQRKHINGMLKNIDGFNIGKIQYSEAAIKRLEERYNYNNKKRDIMTTGRSRQPSYDESDKMGMDRPF